MMDSSSFNLYMQRWTLNNLFDFDGILTIFICLSVQQHGISYLIKRFLKFGFLIFLSSSFDGLAETTFLNNFCLIFVGSSDNGGN